MTAADTGVFARRGLDVELLEPSGGPDNIVRVAEGGADFCLTSVDHYLRARAEQPSIAARFIAIVTQRTPMSAFVIAQRRTAAGVRPVRARDLAGARIAGTSGSRFTRRLLDHLRARGAEPGELVDLPYEDWMPALGAGDVDAVPDFADLLPRMRRHVPAHEVVALRLCDDGDETYGSGVVTSDRLLAERPALARLLIRALVDAWVATRQHPRAGLAAFARRYGEVDGDLVVECWRETERLIFAGPPGHLDPVRWRATLSAVAAAHDLPAPDPESTYTVLA